MALFPFWSFSTHTPPKFAESLFSAIRMQPFCLLLEVSCLQWSFFFSQKPGNHPNFENKKQKTLSEWRSHSQSNSEFRGILGTFRNGTQDLSYVKALFSEQHSFCFVQNWGGPRAADFCLHRKRTRHIEINILLWWGSRWPRDNRPVNQTTINIKFICVLLRTQGGQALSSG